LKVKTVKFHHDYCRLPSEQLYVLANLVDQSEFLFSKNNFFLKAIRAARIAKTITRTKTIATIAPALRLFVSFFLNLFEPDSNIILLCVCLTNDWEKSIRSWLNEIENYAEYDSDIIFVATKNDTYPNQFKAFEKLKTLASNTQFHNCVISTSSKSGNGLPELMDKMVELSYQHIINHSDQKNFIKVHKTVDDPIASEKKCCSN